MAFSEPVISAVAKAARDALKLILAPELALDQSVVVADCMGKAVGAWEMLGIFDEWYVRCVRETGGREFCMDSISDDDYEVLRSVLKIVQCALGQLRSEKSPNRSLSDIKKLRGQTLKFMKLISRDIREFSPRGAEHIERGMARQASQKEPAKSVSGKTMTTVLEVVRGMLEKLRSHQDDLEIVRNLSDLKGCSFDLACSGDTSSGVKECALQCDLSSSLGVGVVLDCLDKLMSGNFSGVRRLEACLVLGNKSSRVVSLSDNLLLRAFWDVLSSISRRNEQYSSCSGGRSIGDLLALNGMPSGGFRGITSATRDVFAPKMVLRTETMGLKNIAVPAVVLTVSGWDLEARKVQEVLNAFPGALIEIRSFWNLPFLLPKDLCELDKGRGSANSSANGRFGLDMGGAGGVAGDEALSSPEAVESATTLSGARLEPEKISEDSSVSRHPVVSIAPPSAPMGAKGRSAALTVEDSSIAKEGSGWER